MCVVRTREELYAADRASGRGPWTEQEILSEDVGGRKLLVCELLDFFLGGGVSSSKYALPEAEGVMPVLRTRLKLKLVFRGTEGTIGVTYRFYEAHPASSFVLAVVIEVILAQREWKQKLEGPFLHQGH